MDDPQAQPEAVSLPRRIALVFGAPGALGDVIRVRPTWFLPALLGMVMVMAGTLLIPMDVWEESMRAQMMAQGQAAPAALQGATMRLVFALGGGVAWFLVLFVFSGIIFLIFAFILGDEARYRHYLSAQAHTNLIAAAGTLLVTPLKVMQRDPQLTLSLGTFAEGFLQEGWLLFFLRGMDLFALWSWIALGVVVSRFDRARSTGSAVGVLLVLLMLLVAGVAWFQAANLS